MIYNHNFFFCLGINSVFTQLVFFPSFILKLPSSLSPSFSGFLSFFPIFTLKKYSAILCYTHNQQFWSFYSHALSYLPQLSSFFVPCWIPLSQREGVSLIISGNTHKLPTSFPVYFLILVLFLPFFTIISSGRQTYCIWLLEEES